MAETSPNIDLHIGEQVDSVMCREARHRVFCSSALTPLLKSTTQAGAHSPSRSGYVRAQDRLIFGVLLKTAFHSEGELSPR